MTEAQREYQRRYYLEHAEKKKQISRDWYLAHKEEMREYWKKNYQENRQDRIDYSKTYYESHKDQISEYHNQYRQEHDQEIRDKKREYSKQRWANDPEFRNRVIARNREYRADRLKNDPVYRLKCFARKRISRALKQQRINKEESVVGLVGCSYEDLKHYIESLWLPGMTWENYNYRGWHIDHKIPCAAFDLMDPEQQRKCFHYTNLQPLWCKDNLHKSASLFTPQPN